MVKTTVKTAEELKQRAEKALKDPKLVEFAKTAPLNKDGRVNLNWAYEQAFQYVYEQTKDLPKAKELALATRWLTMLRRDFPEEFEKLTISLGKPKPELSDGFETPELQLPYISEIKTKINKDRNGWLIEQFVRFYDVHDAAEFCVKLLNALFDQKGFVDGVAFHHLHYTMIQLLEEKFGLKIRICENCKYFLGTSHYSGLKKTTYANIKISDPIPEIRCSEYPGEKLNITVLFTGCKYWSRKEVLEKKEN